MSEFIACVQNRFVFETCVSRPGQCLPKEDFVCNLGALMIANTILVVPLLLVGPILIIKATILGVLEYLCRVWFCSMFQRFCNGGVFTGKAILRFPTEPTSSATEISFTLLLPQLLNAGCNELVVAECGWTAHQHHHHHHQHHRRHHHLYRECHEHIFDCRGSSGTRRHGGSGRSISGRSFVVCCL